MNVDMFVEAAKSSSLIYAILYVVVVLILLGPAVVLFHIGLTEYDAEAAVAGAIFIGIVQSFFLLGAVVEFGSYLSPRAEGYADYARFLNASAPATVHYNYYYPVPEEEVSP